jgi:hypothetical protein
MRTGTPLRLTTPKRRSEKKRSDRIAREFSLDLLLPPSGSVRRRKKMDGLSLL